MQHGKSLKTRICGYINMALYLAICSLVLHIKNHNEEDMFLLELETKQNLRDLIPQVLINYLD